MRYDNIAIPAGFAWTSPFAKWQGALSEMSSIDLAADVTGRALASRGVDPQDVGDLVLGSTIPQPDTFYAPPLLAAMIGAQATTGPIISQACATSVACLDSAAGRVSAGGVPVLVVTTDRTSNGPQLIYPRPRAQGGAPLSTHWTLDSFARDPWAGTSMLTSADLVAAECAINRRELDELAALRSEQYCSALASDRAFQRRYMVPVEVPGKRGHPDAVDADEGVRLVAAEEIAALRPAADGGSHTYATQTHPADGCAGAIVTTVEHARELSEGEGVAQILATGYARAAKSRMPQAPVPAALSALASAGLRLSDIHAMTTHNPFAVNDIYFSRETGYPLERMNAYGSSLIFGHPQGPTGLRSVAELIEELRLAGGGIGLFTGCAAGDTAAALVVRVDS